MYLITGPSESEEAGSSLCSATSSLLHPHLYVLYEILHLLKRCIINSLSRNTVIARDIVNFNQLKIVK